MSDQPKPDSKKYTDLISEIQKGVIKIPKFQRDFVWSIEKTAQLLDSILKGYPIGTFIFWETDERINDIKEIGNLPLPSTPDGQKVQYVLDGQQRITSLYAAFSGAKIQKAGEKKITDYSEIYVDLDAGINEGDNQIITPENTVNRSISLHEVLNFGYSIGKKLEREGFTLEEVEKVDAYARAFKTYEFSIVLLRKEDIVSAIEVFTRINTGGQELTLFEIMSAKTYDEGRNFDMRKKWDDFIEEVKGSNYETISSSVILQILSLVLSNTKEYKRKTILQLDKQKIIDSWNSAISALTEAIEYFRTQYRIPASQILPYYALLVSFAYFFYYQKDKDQPNGNQRNMLEEFFWRMSLSSRYSSSVESKLAQDVNRMDSVLKEDNPSYGDIKVNLHSYQTLIDENFSAGNSYSKAVLCLLASQEPKDFETGAKVILDNSWLKIASSKNYHHFFPRSYLKGKGKSDNANSLMNITLVSDKLNKRRIGARAPSDYIGEFSRVNGGIQDSLESHFIKLGGFGIENDDYDLFLQSRAKWIYQELKKRIGEN